MEVALSQLQGNDPMVHGMYMSVRSLAFVLMLAVLASPLCAAAQTSGSFKVGFYNIKSGTGMPAVAGRVSPFSDNGNCTDATKPLNAWGTGFVQQHLNASIGADPGVIALGLAEAWLCGSPENVRLALGWKARSSERNGTALVARYGFAGPEQWQQLDTSQNLNPADTMWVLRVPVCLDGGCSQNVTVFVTHWLGSGTDQAAVYERQSQATVEFMRRTEGTAPSMLIGDLNVWDSTLTVCSQPPISAGLQKLRDAGYIDAWLLLHGSAEGYSGMLNRGKCGQPIGYAWKRIDYTWSLPSFLPSSIVRFGVVPAGDAAPSDHYGLITEFPRPAESPRADIVAPTAPPIGSFDAPISGAVIAGEVGVTGWAVDDSGIAGVDIYRSPVAGEPTQANGLVFIGTATQVSGARPDIMAAYPAYPGVQRAGWGYLLLTNMLPNRGNGTFSLSAFIRTTDGATVGLGSKTIVLNNANATAPFGTIDTPGQGQTVSGTITSFGWALSPRSMIPTDGSTISVYVDDVFRGHPTYNNFRPDIATLFPGYANSGGAVGFFSVDTRTLANGVHTIAWGVVDSAGYASGIGSRYFTVANGVSAGLRTANLEAPLSTGPVRGTPYSGHEITLDATPELVPPAGLLESPPPDATVSGAILVTGWAVDLNDVQVAAELVIDGQVIGAVAEVSDRPDVCAVYFFVAHCQRSRPGFALPWDTTGYGNGAHTIAVRIRNAPGASALIGERTIVVRN